MSVSSIGSSFVAAVAQTASGSSVSSPAASAAQEASETAQVTAKEAQRGDPVAKRRLAQLQARQRQQQAPPPKATEPGKGTTLDHDA